VVEGSAKEIVDACRDMGLLCCVAGPHVVRFVPPLNIKESNLEEALEMIGDALDEHFGSDSE
jgi:Ornithine/acetylornithine aminotransferase